MTRLRRSLAFSLGRDLLFSAVVGAAVLLVSLYVQLAMTEQELRQRSLDAAASNIARNLVVDAAGNGHLTRAAATAAVGYPTLVFADDGRVLYQRPAGVAPSVVEMLVAAVKAKMRRELGFVSRRPLFENTESPSPSSVSAEGTIT